MTRNENLKVWFGLTQFEIQIGKVVLGLATSHHEEKCRYVFTPILSGLRWPGQTVMGSLPPALEIRKIDKRFQLKRKRKRSKQPKEKFYIYSDGSHSHTHTHTPRSSGADEMTMKMDEGEDEMTIT